MFGTSGLGSIIAVKTVCKCTLATARAANWTRYFKLFVGIVSDIIKYLVWITALYLPTA